MIVNINIPRLAKAPPLTKALIPLLTELCFLPDVNEKSDVIFVFGSSKSLDKMISVIENLPIYVNPLHQDVAI